jgi:hypothetical protein
MPDHVYKPVPRPFPFRHTPTTKNKTSKYSGIPGAFLSTKCRNCQGGKRNIYIKKFSEKLQHTAEGMK